MVGCPVASVVRREGRRLMGASGKSGLDWRPKGGVVVWQQGYCCGRGVQGGGKGDSRTGPRPVGWTGAPKAKRL